MSSISMAPIHGPHSMSHGDYKLHGFLQLSGQGMMVVKGTMMEYEFLPLPKDGYTLLHCDIGLPREVWDPVLYRRQSTPSQS